MSILSKLSDTLNESMILHNLTEKTIAENSGIPISCISGYLHGTQAPYVSTLIRLAEYFGCSVDFLIGRTDKKCAAKYDGHIPFVTRFNGLLKDNKISYNSFKDKNISKTSFFEWKRGKTLPTLENLATIADVCGCSVDYLLGREN